MSAVLKENLYFQDFNQLFDHNQNIPNPKKYKNNDIR